MHFLYCILISQFISCQIIIVLANGELKLHRRMNNFFCWWKSGCLRRSKNHNELLQVQPCLNQSVCQAPLIKPEPTGISLEWFLSGNDSLWCVKCRALFFGICYCDSISPSILCKCINFYSISDSRSVGHFKHLELLMLSWKTI